MKLDSFKLKILVMLLMILDHVNAYLPNMPIWFNYLGRLVSPVFAFLVVEGFFYTSSKLKYITRLFFWALIMFVGSKTLCFILPSNRVIHNNIFLSLGLSVVLMSIFTFIKCTKENKKLMVLGVLLATFISYLMLYTESSIFGVVMTYIFYYYRGKKSMPLVYVLVFLVLNLGPLIPQFINSSPSFIYDNLFLLNTQWMMIFAIILILLYNGKRGINTKLTKYMFYAFYPLHLWIIYIISCYI
ncbi:TraX family protein [Clostridium rectalis]|uniref:TraX family protein n=1 Tax=Clostridium rectalis TaxID=2040295 RepID=UPI000F641C89|nr:TraX family protein [Clostridium rectalis]